MRDQRMTPNPSPSMPPLPKPLGHVVDRYAFRVSPHGQDAEGHEWMEFTDNPEEAGAFPVYTARALRDHAQALADARVREAEGRYAELLQAASNYVNRYALDEADDEGQYWTGCSEQQHKDARRLLDITRSLAGKEGT